MLNFKNIELNDIKTFITHWELTAQRSSDYCFPVLWGWASDYGYQAAADSEDDLFWIRQTIPDTYNLAPVGSWARENWEQLLREKYGDSSIFWLVPEELAKIWQAQFKNAIKLEEQRNHWEYLYNINELAKLAGGRYAKKRNRVNHFKKNYKYEYQPVTEEKIEEIRKFQLRWFQESEGYLPGIRQENDCIMRILDSWGKIPNLCGGIIKIDDKIIAYTIGELVQDTVLIHFEKALSEYNTGYQVINNEFLVHLLHSHSELTTVNREEDLGDPGLRDAKLSYNPIGFIKKYKITINFGGKQ